ncbi:MAG: bifunctional folylpolyglutamate synthase/dihydrofolate synthase [Bacteroidota bacterium]
MNRFDAACDWLVQRLPMFQRQGGTPATYRLDLSKTEAWLERLGNPHRAYPCIHVAGTNGKGSTCHMLASIFHEAGMVVGLHTSPHMLDLRERFRVGGRLVPERWVADFVDAHRADILELDLSFFEATVGMAFAAFRDARVDLAVVEVGMGGRLDSTNVVTPLVSVITSIGLDHMAFLGPDRASIAREKAGIFKPKVMAIVGESDTEILPVFEEVAASLDRCYVYPIGKHDEVFPTDLQGDYQVKNARTAIMAARVARHRLLDHQIRRGLMRVVANTGLRGRWDVLEAENPLVVADSAHNGHAWIPVIKQWNRVRAGSTSAMVLGVVSDKDTAELIALIPQACRVYACAPDIPRALAVHDWAAQLRAAGRYVVECPSVAHAINMAKADGFQAIYVGGSSFVVADALAAYRDGRVSKRRSASRD